MHITHKPKPHVEMDNAVTAAYDWSDLDLGHGFHGTRSRQTKRRSTCAGGRYDVGHGSISVFLRQRWRLGTGLCNPVVPPLVARHR